MGRWRLVALALASAVAADAAVWALGMALTPKDAGLGAIAVFVWLALAAALALGIVWGFVARAWADLWAPFAAGALSVLLLPILGSAKDRDLGDLRSNLGPETWMWAAAVGIVVLAVAAITRKVRHDPEPAVVP